MNTTDSRPQIQQYQEPSAYVADMLTYRRAQQPAFSVYRSCQGLRRISPALVSLVVAKKRSLTLDRVDEFARLLEMTALEKIYMKDWLARLQAQKTGTPLGHGPGSVGVASGAVSRSRKDVSPHILTDWVNAYVKDCFQIPEICKNPKLIYAQLANIASQKRIDRAISFLLKEGHLRRTLDGRIEVEVNLTSSESPLPSQKIRNFHKASLQLAKNAIEQVPPTERFANSLVIPLDENGYQEILQLIKEFSEKLQEYASEQKNPGPRLYQILVNASPTGGKAK